MNIGIEEAEFQGRYYRYKNPMDSCVMLFVKMTPADIFKRLKIQHTFRWFGFVKSSQGPLDLLVLAHTLCSAYSSGSSGSSRALLTRHAPTSTPAVLDRLVLGATESRYALY